MPRVRFTRKVIIISFGMLALLGGSGAAALYVGADKLLGEPQASAAGGQCTTIQTMVLKTPAKRLWLRKYVRMDNADGPTRIRTALRVAGVLAKSNAVDLIQVSVLDAHGPDKRADMRGRAIGAEVTFALEPHYLPEMKQPFTARYYDGVPTSEGRFYGRKVTLEVASIQKLMTSMKSEPDLEGCIEPERPEDAAAGSEHGKPSDQTVSAANEHGKPAVEGEHAAPGDEAKADPTGHETAPKKEQSFLDGILSMVGLGSSEEKVPEGKQVPESHEAKVDDNGPAVADDAIEPVPAAADHGEKSADATAHDSPPIEQDAH
jgi:hypothetical protein